MKTKDIKSIEKSKSITDKAKELKEIIMRMINGEKFQQICPVH